MKNLFTLISFFAFFLSVCSINAATDTLYAGGSGTEGDPFLIETSDHLNNVRENPDAYFLQVGNIHLDSVEFGQGLGWDPIGSCDEDLEGNPFTGYYNGGGYEISGLFINRSDLVPSGLFGCTRGAVLINVDIADAHINSSARSGALVGYNFPGPATTIDGITVGVSGEWGEDCGGIVGLGDSVILRNSQVILDASATDRSGGLAGFLSNSEIIDSEATGTLSGEEHLGGIIGRIDDGLIDNAESRVNIYPSGGESGGIVGDVNRSTIQNSQFDGEILSPDRECGGIVGIMFVGSIINCTSSGNLECLGAGGGLIGNMADGIIDGCHSSMTVNATSGGGGGLAGIGNRSNISNSSFNGVVGNEGGGQFVGGIVGFIGQSTHLSNVSSSGQIFGNQNVGGISGSLGFDSHLLNATSDATVVAVQRAGGLVGDLNAATIDSVIFNGSVEANESVGGIVGVVSGNDLSSITYAINAGNVSGGDRTGGIAGHQNGGLSIAFCSNMGDVEGAERVGGIIGENSNSQGNYSFVEVGGSVSGTDAVGGFFGYIAAADELTIEFVTVMATISGNDYVGGLTGYGENIVVRNVRSEATISANSRVGGIAGELAESLVELSSFSGSIDAESVSGGIAGHLTESEVRNSFARGSVFETNAESGGIASTASVSHIFHTYSTVDMGLDNPDGNNILKFNLNSEVVNSYFLSSVVTGYDPDFGKGLSIESMTYRYGTEVYEDWDFNEIWRHDFQGDVNDGLPYLKSEEDEGFYYVRILLNVETRGTAAGDGYFDSGDAVTLIATPEDGFDFVHWTDTIGNIISDDADYVFDMPSENLYLIPVFDEGTNTRELPDIQISIYPNPVREFLIVETEDLIQSVVLFNQNGSEVARHNSTGNRVMINTGDSGLPSGIYTLKVRFSNGAVYHKISLFGE